MKLKNLFRVLLFLTIVLILNITLNILFPSDIVKVYRDKIEKGTSKNQDIKSIAFGRSHGVALNYNKWDLPGINYSIGGQDIKSIEYLIRYMTSQQDSIKEVLIAISYSSLYFDDTALAYGNLNDARKNLYASLPTFKLIEPNDFQNLFFGKFLSFTRSDYGYRDLKRLISKSKYDSHVTSTSQLTDSLNVINTAVSQAFDHSKDKNIATSYNPNIVKENIESLENIAQFLLKKNINCYFYTPPYHYLYTQNFPKEDIRFMKNTMKDITQEYSNCQYFDFSENKEISNHARYFSNSDHLNLEIGFDAFTSLLLDTIRKSK